MNPESEARADALLRAIARQGRTAAAESDAPAAEPGDAERVARISAAVLARLPSSPPLPRARRAQAPLRALAAAAVLVVAVLFGTQAGRSPSPTLPPYQLEVAGLDAATRSLPGAEPVGRATASVGNRLLLVLRPQRAVTTPIVGELWRVDAAHATRLSTPVAVSAQGALFVDAVVGTELALEPGSHRLWVVARDPRARIAAEQLVDAASPRVAPGVHALAFELEVVPAGGAVP